jgi:hypothetical protein
MQPYYFMVDANEIAWFISPDSGIYNEVTIEDIRFDSHTADRADTAQNCLRINGLLKNAKTSLSSIGSAFNQIRGKVNEYEGISKGVFLNRSAMKMVHTIDLIVSNLNPYISIYSSLHELQQHE